ncbi:phage major capsid protein [Thermanaerosceptrum fracticalcis]|uniref:Phage major capsid protein n=1 Tax=Thermanaerosceptrum fracticalcis TaxID=1712410 RepID=A0A7G6E190_THEFR|nr:phage major capsid protein [Thermanaerosceptrum fracticalcis]QNB45844.1 phage major capsid protein [Thermanaerosceptrum fracticalcis]
MALNYNAITALTRKKHVPKLVDNFFNSHPLLVLLKKRDKGYSPFEGHSIVEPLMYGELNNVGSYGAYDTTNYDQSTPITAAEFAVKHLVAPITLSFPEEVQNHGSDVKVLDLLDAKYQVAEETLMKKFSTQLYGDGTGNSGKDITGLGACVAASGTYGNISPVDFAGWVAQVDSNSGQARPLNTRMMRRMFLSSSDGPDKPDLIITTDKIWNRYAEMAEGKLQLSTNSKMLADLGFQVLEFMGVPIVADKDCTAGTMFFLNTKYLKLRYSPIANFKATPVRPADTYIGIKQEILWSGNLTCSNRRRQGKITDIDETGY